MSQFLEQNLLFGWYYYFIRQSSVSFDLWRNFKE